MLPRVVGEMQREAPAASVEWLAPSAQTLLAVAESQIDLALVNSSVALPEGVERQGAGELHSVTFVRKDHPAIANWSLEAWAKWPHLQVQLGDREKGAVDKAAAARGVKRTIAAAVPNFSLVPAIVAETDLLATMTPLVMDGAMSRLGLRALEPPLPIPPASFSFVWSFRLSSDPGSRWFRALVMRAYAELYRTVTLSTTGPHLVKARRRRAARGPR